jgi:hypothetical protein
MAGFVYFAPDSIAFERLAGGRAIYRVELPQLRYQGRVLIATARHHGPRPGSPLAWTRWPPTSAIR